MSTSWCGNNDRLCSLCQPVGVVLSDKSCGLIRKVSGESKWSISAPLVGLWSLLSSVPTAWWYIGGTLGLPLVWFGLT